MKLFAKIGELVLEIFDLIGMLILAIPKIPDKLRNVNTDNIKNKVDTDSLKENLSKVKDTGLEIGNSKISGIKSDPHSPKDLKEIQSSDAQLSEKFTSEEKEKTVFGLQIASGAFLVVSILYIFNFISFNIYGVLGILLIAYTVYTLFSKVKLMYSADFNAYRDFFFMYIAAGIILVLLSNDSDLIMTFSYSSLPISFSVLIFAIILVIAIYVIFRIRYHRSYTHGIVIDSGKKTAYVKVEYDIRSNVKPDIYLVENSYGAADGDVVKLQVEEKLLSTGGNKPVSIIETLKQ